METLLCTWGFYNHTEDISLLRNSWVKTNYFFLFPSSLSVPFSGNADFIYPFSPLP